MLTLAARSSLCCNRVSQSGVLTGGILGFHTALFCVLDPLAARRLSIGYEDSVKSS